MYAISEYWGRGWGLGMIAQLVPSKWQVVADPTAQTSVTETTSTPLSGTPHPFLTARHRDPFHRRVSPLSGKPTPPTAQTSLGAATATDDRMLGRLDPPGFGLRTMFQADPFHRSIRVVLLRLPKSSAY